MAKDQRFDLGPNMSGMAMGKAKKAMSGSARSMQMKVDQPDAGGPASVADNLNRSKQTVVPTLTKPAMGATPPSKVNPMQRPGEGARRIK